MARLVQSEGTTKITRDISGPLPTLTPDHKATRRLRAESERRTACWESLWELWAEPGGHL